MSKKFLKVLLLVFLLSSPVISLSAYAQEEIYQITETDLLYLEETIDLQQQKIENYESDIETLKKYSIELEEKNQKNKSKFWSIVIPSNCISIVCGMLIILIFV